MKLTGSCHCQRVTFEVESEEYVPFMRCYCSICRKTSGGGGYLINLGAKAATLRVEGRDHVGIYRAMLERDGKVRESRHERHFCRECGSHLWAFSPKWPELVHPVAAAIDTPLPTLPETVHIMVGSKAPWVDLSPHASDEQYDRYPPFSLAEWHQRHPD